MPYFCIRHIPSGDTIPNAHGKSGRGGSHVEPTPSAKEFPKIFSAERHARGWLTTWLKGKYVRKVSYSEEETIDIIPQPHRKREEYEIIPVSFKFGKAELLAEALRIRKPGT